MRRRFESKVWERRQFYLRRWESESFWRLYRRASMCASVALMRGDRCRSMIDELTTDRHHYRRS